MSGDPFVLFRSWLAEALVSEPVVHDAVALATVDERGAPSVRMVLLKDLDDRGFVVYTHFSSPKGRQMTRNPRAALCFHWKSLRRQVRAEGDVELVSDAVSDAYFATRARDSQLGAWASRQSDELGSRKELEDRMAAMAERFPDEVPRPPSWGGFRIVPERLEFWVDRDHRLHDRAEYRRTSDGWRGRLLYP
ncbi:MAG: pyridoxamine 5'-phosphate oxidase [Alphaproteobacteria bacterium]|nr:pyridoxamine 5'-phosphate oxidase [Alphaproteobacteria bacterium]MCB9696817.1 pyridoxamine 5'-phosphate oxidase [Alphaproteobacteria bacterium]